MKRWPRRLTVFVMTFVLMVVAGIGMDAGYVYLTEVPTGYRRIDWGSDLASKMTLHGNWKAEIDKSLFALEGQKVFLKGYLYPAGRIEGLTQFGFVAPQSRSPYFEPLSVGTFATVRLADGETTHYREGLVSVWGTLNFDRVPSQEGAIINFVDAHCMDARSAF